jgi:carbonic anhydrase
MTAPTESSEPGIGVAVDSTAAIDLLSAGNDRLQATIEHSEHPDEVRASFAKANPYAIVLGCADSRVPPEVVFDELPGRLFVVRVASAIAGPNEIGSIEYALARWACPLVVVLGHTECGGVAASLDKLPPGAEPQPDPTGWMHLSSLVFSIRSAIGDTSQCAACPDPWREAVELNVRKTVDVLLNWSEPIRRRVTAGELRVVGAVYDVRTARVEFLER